MHCSAARPQEGSSAIAEHLDFTQKIISDCSLFQIPKFINISSQSVYGFSLPPLWHERMAPAPETVYAMSKLSSEYMIGGLKRISRTSFCTSLRLARLYGAAEGMRWNEVPHRFALQAVRGEEIRIIGGSQRFDLIHIDDAVDAIILVVESDHKKWKPIYNLGSGGSLGIMEVAEAAIHSARKIVSTNGSINLQTKASQMLFGMNTDRFCNDFAWKPSVTLGEAMDGIARYAVEYANASKKRL